jgi:hypothetical protein
MIVFSPIRQHPVVLDLFLGTLAVQNVEVWCYDDNDSPESSEILQTSDVRILDPIDLEPADYTRGEDTHHWQQSTIRRVAAIKNHAIDLFLETDHERLFLIDSDVLLPPDAIAHLAEADLPVIAGIYWTRWHPHQRPSPNIFPPDDSTLRSLRKPGHWPVAGLGACTLIRRDVFEKARFTEQRHLVNRGEDYWFCWLCHQAAIPLVACTHLDIFHLYRDSDLPAAVEWTRERK